LPRRLRRREHVCARRAPARQRSASDDMPLNGARLDTVQGGTAACAHGRHGKKAAEERRGHTGSGRRTAVAVGAWPGPFGGSRVPVPVTARKCVRRRARSPTTSPDGRRGWTTGRSGAAHLAWPAHRESARRASRRAAPEMRPPRRCYRVCAWKRRWQWRLVVNHLVLCLHTYVYIYL
jgi:hypothetical protein